MTPRPDLAPSDSALLAEVRGVYDDVDPVPPGLAGAAWARLAAQPVEYTVTRYNCPFCRRYPRSARKPVAAHIARCWKNPAVRSCVTCRHFDVQSPEIAVGAPGVEWCGARDAELDRITVHCPLWALRGETA